MTKKMTHWIEDDMTHKKFWAYVKSDLGLTEDEVHRALGVESIKNFTDDKTAAMTLLQNYAAGIVPRRVRDALSAQEIEHAEARVIAFCDLYAPDGARISLTAREGARHDDLVATTLALIDAAKTLVNVFNFSVASQKPNNKQPAAKKPPIPARPAPPLPPGNGPPSSAQTGALPAGNSNGGGTETFLVDSVTAQVSPNGNRYYAVKGGRVKKHGATAWPEVAEPQLEALTQYNPSNLEIGKPWDVTGFGIRAVGEIPPGKTYPSKITAFAPPVNP